MINWIWSNWLDECWTDSWGTRLDWLEPIRRWFFRQRSGFGFVKAECVGMWVMLGSEDLVLIHQLTFVSNDDLWKDHLVNCCRIWTTWNGADVVRCSHSLYRNDLFIHGSLIHFYNWEKDWLEMNGPETIKEKQKKRFNKSKNKSPIRINSINQAGSCRTHFKSAENYQYNRRPVNNPINSYLEVFHLSWFIWLFHILKYFFWNKSILSIAL